MINYQETSREAWEAFVPHRAKLDRQIMESLRDAGAEGLMCFEIEKMTGRSHQAVSANLSRLKNRGLVKPTGACGKTAANRRAMKWTVA